MIAWLILGGLTCILLGAYLGVSAATYVFNKMAEQGQLVFKSDNKWEGEPSAMAEILLQAVKK